MSKKHMCSTCYDKVISTMIFIIFIHIRTFVYIWTNFGNHKIDSNKKEIRKNNINKIKMKY
ncbi:hypothetical protein BpHYR1_023245 [Brachionus plicatilis]|uniref:Uncharacterized protein n=1 Tax=Brachionus plicatilis TaxID=10195 RepID=A0A3M7S8I9_BRAPC|nr:hypothetical protein BpHYR1_023245 [Brachionus plicatilis]